MEHARDVAKRGGVAEPIVLTVANRLFGRQGYEFRKPFLDLVNEGYGTPLQLMDFVANAGAERVKINRWVEERTKNRIADLIPSNGLSDETRLVLVNAIYLKAPWDREFPARATRPLPFHAKDGEAAAPASSSVGSATQGELATGLARPARSQESSSS